jgi:hypothetical protein
MSVVFLLLLLSWDISGNTGVDFSHNFYNQEWEGNEIGSFDGIYNLNINIENNYIDRLKFNNEFELNYGITYIEDEDNKEWRGPEKSTDKIENESILALTMGWKIDPFVSLRFQSKFLDNTYETLPRYFNPLIISQSVGASKAFLIKNNNEIQFRLGFTIKEIIENEVDTTRMVIKDLPVGIEGGLEWVLSSKFQFSNNISYRGKLRIFNSFSNYSASEIKESIWRRPDVNFENRVILSFNKFLQMNLYFQLLYNQNGNSKLQIKENLNAGVNISIF